MADLQLFSQQLVKLLLERTKQIPIFVARDPPFHVNASLFSSHGFKVNSSLVILGARFLFAASSLAVTSPTSLFALADALLPGPLSVLVPAPRLLDLRALDGALGVVLLVDLAIVVV